ncbi:MAG: cupin domain-containing protein [Synechococcaceae cyanobacterium]
MNNAMTARDVCERLALEPNQTCGFVRSTYSSPLKVPQGTLPSPFDEARPVGSALYFLVTPTAPVRLHRIRNDQLYHYYLGDPIELLLLRPDGTTDHVVIGPALAEGQHVQFPIPGGTFHMARLLGDGSWFLGGSTEWPGVLPSDVEIGDGEELARRYPEAAELIRSAACPLA